jgi:transcriptional regulator with XRE-family HTH domain
MQELGNDLRTARLSAGLTLREVAAAIGVAPTTVLRWERARLPGPRPEMVARHAAAVGMRVRIKAYPDGAPVRDAPSLRLAAAFRVRLPTRHPFRPEVPVSGTPGDRRAWDGVLDLPGCSIGLEFVTRFHDCQAQIRGFQLKLRDGSVDRLIVVVAATHANRRALALARDVVTAAFPLATRAVMAALAADRDPGENGIVLITLATRDKQRDTPNA